MSGDTRPKTAVLLIHGMGQQSRYQTLLKVAELIEEQPGYSVAKLSPSEQPEGLERSVRVNKNGKSLADLYEYYWAPRTARLIGVTATLLWFLRQSIPRRGQLARTTSAASAGKTALNVFWVLVSVAIVFFLSVGAATWAKASLNSFDEHQAGWTEVRQGFGEAAAEFVECFGEDDQTCSARDYWSLIRELLNPFNLLPEQGDEGEAEAGDRGPLSIGQLLTRGGVLAFVGGVLAYLLFQALRFGAMIFTRKPAEQSVFGDEALPSSWWYWVRAAGFFVVFAGLVLPAGHAAGNAAIAAVAAFLLWAIRSILRVFVRDSLGDVASYLDRDEYAAWYQARREIMDDGMKTYASLVGVDVEKDFEAEPCADPRAFTPHECSYERVVVVGHSLGSVIAVDILRQFQMNLDKYFNEVSRRSMNARLASVITLGSPLSYIAYVYGRAPDNANRLSFLYTDTLREVFRAEMTWINGYYANDAVANHVSDTYEYGYGENGDTRPVDKRLGLGIPIVSHTRYFDDPYVILLLLNELCGLQTGSD